MYNPLGSIAGIPFDATMNLAAIQLVIFFVVFEGINAQYQYQSLQQKTFPIRYRRVFDCEGFPLRDIRAWVVDLKSRVSVGPFKTTYTGLLQFFHEITVPVTGSEPVIEMRFYFQCGCVGMYREIFREPDTISEVRHLYPLNLKPINLFDQCKNQPVPYSHCIDQFFPRKHKSCEYQKEYA
uniref:Secreted protein n=2 Tax=Panagrellus redivivus TaxID=6233 RepID=A0A7E4VC51_PANRE